MRPLLFLGIGLVALATTRAASPMVLRSGARVVPLVELFTSEGCSSCPPAERWLGQLRHEPSLWIDFVPVAWHVNYWDRLGWPDRFAAADYTQRQYAYAKTWRNGRVYTPGFVRNGLEWRPNAGDLAAGGSGVAPVGELVVTVVGSAGVGAADAKVEVEVVFEAKDANADELTVHVARLGGGLISSVGAGENRGKRLEHEFLVLNWTQAPLRDGRASVVVPALGRSDSKRLGLAALPERQAWAIWVSAGDDPRPIQATGGWWQPE